MELLLIRHAEAGERDPGRWPDDAARPVTPEGRRRQIAQARGMKALGLDFDHLVTSPFTRARETAEIVAEVYSWKGEVAVSEALVPDATPAALAAALATWPTDATVALVGHEPCLSRAAGAFIARGAAPALQVKKGGVVGVRFDGAPAVGRGTLTLLLRPRLLRRAQD